MDSFARSKCRKLPEPARELIAEMMGTFILVIFGVGSVAQYKFGGSLGVPFLSVNLGWGIGAMLGIYWSAGVSGGHINPAITLAMVVAGRLPLRKLPHYWIGQLLGAFIASAVCYGVYYDLLVTNEPGERSLNTAGIWSTYPSNGVSSATIFCDQHDVMIVLVLRLVMVRGAVQGKLYVTAQLVATALLVGTATALTDKHNNAPSPQVLPICAGLLVIGIGTSFGINVGYGINPARDLMPRIFTALAGWNKAPFEYQNSFFYIPLLGQFAGAIIGGAIYIFGIEMHHPEEKTYADMGLINRNSIVSLDPQSWNRNSIVSLDPQSWRLVMKTQENETKN